MASPSLAIKIRYRWWWRPFLALWTRAGVRAALFLARLGWRGAGEFWAASLKRAMHRGLVVSHVPVADGERSR